MGAAVASAPPQPVYRGLRAILLWVALTLLGAPAAQAASLAHEDGEGPVGRLALRG
jgi:hypothetical protein